MGRDPYRRTQRGVSLVGMALVIVAVVLGLALSTSVLWYETQQRAANQVASAAQPTGVPAAPQPSVATAAPTKAPAPTTTPTAAPTATVAGPTSPAATAAPTKAPVPTAAPTKPASAPVPAGSADAGGKLFAASCNGCHPGGNAGLGPGLKGVSAAEVIRVVREGKGVMPAFAPSQLSDQQLQDIVAYLGSLS